MYFRDIIGLTDVKKHLIQSVQRGFIPHARLIYGAEGVGKLPLTTAYARYLHCEHRGSDDACGSCPACKKIDKFAHPDLHFVFPVVKSKVCDEYLPQWRDFLQQNKYFNLNNWLGFIQTENAQGVIYAKESDEIIRKLNLKVYESQYKIMIVWLPEKMHDACANKLLKMVEEPPKHTIFLLVSEEPESLLITIRSRCQPLHIGRIAQQDMIAALESKNALTRDDALSVEHIAHGSYAKALELVEGAGQSAHFFELFVSMMRAAVSRNIKMIKSVSSELAGIGREMQKSFLSFSLRMFREYFINNLQHPEMVYLNRQEKEFGVRFSPFINEKNIEQLSDEFSTAYRQIEQNGNARIIFLDLCLKITVLLKK